MKQRVADHIALLHGVGSFPVTTSVYDMGDRRTEVNHPASGITSFTYDPLGNVLTKQTANMAEEGKMITYTYDYHRLTGINYPDHPENNVKYYYGGRNASYNRIGRLMMREDGTGAIEYFYGKMGEVTKTRRTLIVPNQAIATYVTQWTYDSHNRLIEMIYPDEEKVTYSYNLGGLLEKVRGEKSYGYDYITKLGYDKFEQRSYLKYCNGAETFYTYDDRRRLSNLAVNSGGTSIMDNDYTFDAVSNVLSVANNASLPANGNADGQMSHIYTYDGLYRLATATGTYTGADNKSASYTLAMGYDNMHRIKSKSQHLTQDNVQFNGTLNVGYDLTYTYGSEEGKKFQLESVKDVNYRTEETPEGQQIENGHVYSYDKNGNLVYVNTNRVMTDGHRDNSVGERKLIWDEENRLLAVDDNGFVSNYWYDADGERTVKTSGESDQVYVNGVFSGGSTNTAKFSLYVSPYLVANQGGRYTKHIYAGSQRIVSKVGDFASYGSDPRRIEYAGANTDGLSVDYKSKYAAQQQVIKDNYKFFDVPYNGTDNDNYADGEGFCCNDGSMEAAVAQARKAQARAVSRSFKDPDNYENLQFFYHPDHLGSSSFITNLEGEVVQHIEYVPFGEVFIEERNNVWNTPYLFNAKEFDDETGMYYYGARYYDPRLSLWMSTDIMQESYPNIASYTFVANNPLNYIDYDGNDIVQINNEGRVSKVILNNSDDITVRYPNSTQAAFSSIKFASTTWEWLTGGNSKNRQIIANIFGYYAKKVGVVGVGAKAESNGKDNVPAYFSLIDKKIWLNPNSDGTCHAMFNNKNNLMNTIVHESLHKNNDLNGISETHLTHAKVVLDASLHSSYASCTIDYRKSQVGYFSQLVMNAYFKDNSKEAALNLIEQYNKANLGVQLTLDEVHKKMILKYDGDSKPKNIKYKRSNSTSNL